MKMASTSGKGADGCPYGNETPKAVQKDQVLDPRWTLKMKDAGIGCPALSSLSIPVISHFKKSSRQDPTVTAQREWLPRTPFGP
jgi:hypothetical protein